MVYIAIAGPSAIPDPAKDARRAVSVAEELLASGLVAPVLPQTTLAAAAGSPVREAWSACDMELLARCDALLSLPGDSCGPCAEEAWAQMAGIPVFAEACRLLSWARPQEEAVLVGLGHRAGVGKDTAARLLASRHGFRRLAFADALKQVAWDISRHLDPATRSSIVSMGMDEAKRADPTVRELLVDLGCALRRRIGPEVLSAVVLGCAQGTGERVVVSDVRFPDEAEALRRLGARLVRIGRPAAPPRRDRCEEALAGWGGWDAVVVNDGGLEDLAERLEEALGLAA